MNQTEATLTRSIEVLNTQTLRILKCFGKETVKKSTATVDIEQACYLINKNLYKKRTDLIYTGRTLFGNKPPMTNHIGNGFFSATIPRDAAFLHDLEAAYSNANVNVKIKQDEAVPAQYKLNFAFADNTYVIETLHRIADQHNLVCLLHEKPFAGINSSGKNILWTLNTDTQTNLFNPGTTQAENMQFLLFLTAVMQAVDEYQDIFRGSTANTGNDHRLGCMDAPPIIVSLSLGDELTAFLSAIEQRGDITAAPFPTIPPDYNQQNPTAPIFFTGTGFTFQMPGASDCIARSGIVFNTMVADVLARFADELENAADFKTALSKRICQSISNHKRIIFNGNPHNPHWKEEAHNRGLTLLPNTVDALTALLTEKSAALFTRHAVFTKTELTAQYTQYVKHYIHTIQIEAATFIDIVKKQIIPACINYQNDLTALVAHKLEELAVYDSSLERQILTQISNIGANLLDLLRNLERMLAQAAIQPYENELAHARYYNFHVAPAMAALRQSVDELESVAAEKHWPLLTYGDLLYSL